MTAFGSNLHQDAEGIRTSADYGDTGAGVTNWAEITKSADGGHVTTGAKADAAVTDPTSSGSIIALLKGLLSFARVSTTGILKGEDAAHASGDSGVMSLGVRNDARATRTSADGDYASVSLAPAGQIFNSPVPENSSGWALSAAASAALAASLIIKASAGKLFKLQIVNTNAVARYFQVHNSATLPADTAVPVFLISVPALSSIEVDFTVYGRYFSTGIVICNSTTAATKTIGAADAWFNALYL